VTRGRFWLRVSILVAIVFGLVGEHFARRMGIVPSGSAWGSVTAYAICAVLGWIAFAIVLTKSGR